MPGRGQKTGQRKKQVITKVITNEATVDALRSFLDQLMRNRFSDETFNDSVFLELTTLDQGDYVDFIKRPMWFGMIRQALDDGSLTSVDHFVNAVYLVLKNALAYSPERKDLVDSALEVWRTFNTMLAAPLRKAQPPRPVVDGQGVCVKHRSKDNGAALWAGYAPPVPNPPAGAAAAEAAAEQTLVAADAVMGDIAAATGPGTDDNASAPADVDMPNAPPSAPPGSALAPTEGAQAQDAVVPSATDATLLPNGSAREVLEQLQPAAPSNADDVMTDTESNAAASDPATRGLGLAGVSHVPISGLHNKCLYRVLARFQSLFPDPPQVIKQVVADIDSADTLRQYGLSVPPNATAAQLEAAKQAYLDSKDTRDGAWGGTLELYLLSHATNGEVAFLVVQRESVQSIRSVHPSSAAVPPKIEIPLHFCRLDGASVRSANHWNTLDYRMEDGSIKSHWEPRCQPETDADWAHRRGLLLGAAEEGEKLARQEAREQLRASEDAARALALPRSAECQTAEETHGTAMEDVPHAASPTSGSTEEQRRKRGRADQSSDPSSAEEEDEEEEEEQEQEESSSQATKGDKRTSAARNKRRRAKKAKKRAQDGAESDTSDTGSRRQEEEHKEQEETSTALGNGRKPYVSTAEDASPLNVSKADAFWNGVLW